MLWTPENGSYICDKCLQCINVNTFGLPGQWWQNNSICPDNWVYRTSDFQTKGPWFEPVVCFKWTLTNNQLNEWWQMLTEGVCEIVLKYNQPCALFCFRAREKYFYRWTRAKTPPPHRIRPVKGSVHIAVNRHFVNFSLNDPRSKDFLVWLQKTEIPDETFFSSLNHNPHLGINGSFLGRRWPSL